MVDKAILYDATKCTACRGCQAACKQWNENDEAVPQAVVDKWSLTRFSGTYENPPDLSPSTWLKMRFTEQPAASKMRWFFTRVACMHCTDAGCVRVCPNHTLYHNEWGTVSYNKDTCTGCGYCIQACPFNVPRYTRNVFNGIAKMDKCTFCTTLGLDRVDKGLQPACVKSCPPGALTYGDREKMVAQAKARVQSLQGKGFTKANLYGENELNGLHVLYVLEDSPALYGLPESPSIPDVSIAWKSVIHPLGWAVGGLTIVGLGLNYMVARANALKEGKGK